MGVYGPAVMLGDPPADGKPHSGAFICASSVQSLKKGKDALGMLLIEADAVVFHKYQLGFAPFAFGRVAVNFDQAWFFSMELQSIGDQVLEKLAHLAGLCLDNGQVIHCYVGLIFPYLPFQVSQHPLHYQPEIDGAKACSPGGDT